MSEKSFKERVREEMVNAAIQYKQVYVDYEYLTKTSHTNTVC